MSQSADNTIFEVKDLGYVYQGRITALDGVSLTIKRGERVAILGANGSGKSTLLKLLDGLYFPTSGELRAFGRVLTEETMAEDAFAQEFRRRVGLVFQDADVQLFSPTVWDEVAFGPLHLGLPRQELKERVQAVLELVGIEGLAQRTPHQLSGGEKKKVALASVLVLEPEVLLMDEPTANLDPRSQRFVADLLIEMGEMGKTVITATHDLDIVEEIAERVYVLGESKQLVAEGSTHQVLSDEGLLLATNLIHQHQHRHPDLAHLHPHRHLDFHDHVH